MTRIVAWAVVVLAGCAHAPHRRGPAPPPTLAETTQFAKTGHYDEAVSLCTAYADAYPDVRCEQLGTTGEGRPIVAVRVHRGAGDHKRPTILVEGGIHAGEIEGKDAGFMFLRDLLDDKVAPGALDVVDFVFVPVINPDGHERFAPNNRPNQRGPEAMGFRTNGARQNLNRDWVKADTPEIQALLKELVRRDPIVFVDIHTTDGAKFEHDVSVTVGPRAPRADHFEQVAVGLGEELATDLTERGHLPVTFYPSFVKDEDPKSGFAVGEAPPRFSQVYAGERSRIGILVENHSWRPYEHRVHTTYDFLRALFERAKKEAPGWEAAAARARIADYALGGSELPVVFENTQHTIPLQFRGYEYEQVPSDVSGGTWIRYDETKPAIWEVPLFDEIIPKVTAHVPRGGYIVTGGFANAIAAVLDRHGIHYKRIPGSPRLYVEVFRAKKVQVLPIFEGRARMAFEGKWEHETRGLDRGAIFIPIAQANARLIVHLLDPAAPDSLAQWGELAAVFEQKEYLEPYVAEEQARELLAADPSLRTKFDAAVAADPVLAASPQARLDWFYKRSPMWDDRVNLLPIYRTDIVVQ